MFAGSRFRRGLRGAALWGVMTTGAVAITAATAPALAAGPLLLRSGPAFTDVLVTGSAAAALVATAGLWVITTDVVVRVLAADGDVVVRRPGPLRALLLAACGVVVLTSTVAPAAADDRRPITPPSLAGLPLPDRATGPAAPPDRARQEAPARVRVRPGDSLWAIARERLGPAASPADIATYWPRIYDRNVAVIGPDPDLILPGQLLELPPTG